MSTDQDRAVAGCDPRLTIRRVLVGHAYAANGNLSNPTPRYMYHLLVDGQIVDSSERERVLRRAAKECGASYIAEIDARACAS